LLLARPAEHTTRLVYPSLLQDPSLSNKTPIDGMDTRAIVGLAAGVVAALFLFTVGVFFVYRRRQRLKNGFHLDGTNTGPKRGFFDWVATLFKGYLAPLHDLESQQNNLSPSTGATPFQELSPKPSDGQNPNRQTDDYKGDPNDPASNTLSKTSIMSYHSTRVSKSFIYLHIAVVCGPKQDLTSGFFSDKEKLLFPGDRAIFSLFFDYEIKMANGHCPTIQRWGKDIGIDGIIYEEDIEMIESVAVPRLPIPKLNQRDNKELLIREKIPQIIVLILEKRQKAGSEASATANSS
ncbi:hypothetical protein EDB81DRAFT_119421, partial [Dactylonectria macrodidyma]